MKSVDQPSHVYTVNILTEVEGQVALGRPKLLETIKRRQKTGIFIIWKEIKVAATADELTTAKVTVSTKKCLQNKKSEQVKFERLLAIFWATLDSSLQIFEFVHLPLDWKELHQRSEALLVARLS